MNRKSVAVLDVGSAKVTVLIGERGVNKTFVFKGVHSEKYDGYADAAFFDTKDLQRAVAASLEGAERNCGDRIRSIYVGVPGEFSRVINSRCMTSFRSKRRVTASDVDVLFANGFYEPVRGFTPVRQTAVCYVTSDRRRTIDPVGMISDSLEGYLCYFLADDRYIEILRNILLEYGVREVHFLPAALAEALYLIPSEKRDEYAILLDVGYLSMTFSIVCGNGIVSQSACSAGGGYISAYAYGDGEEGVPFHAVEAMIGKINLSGRESENAVIEYTDKTRVYSMPVRTLKQRVREGLDVLCEEISKQLDAFGEGVIDYKPVLLTGEGITGIRGVCEHMAGRLNRMVEIVAPDLPYYNKASQSSLLSLLDMALTVKREGSLLHKILKVFGG